MSNIKDFLGEGSSAYTTVSTSAMTGIEAGDRLSLYSDNTVFKKGEDGFDCGIIHYYNNGNDSTYYGTSIETIRVGDKIVVIKVHKDGIYLSTLIYDIDDYGNAIEDTMVSDSEDTPHANEVIKYGTYWRAFAISPTAFIIFAVDDEGDDDTNPFRLYCATYTIDQTLNTINRADYDDIESYVEDDYTIRVTQDSLDPTKFVVMLMSSQYSYAYSYVLDASVVSTISVGTRQSWTDITTIQSNSTNHTFDINQGITRIAPNDSGNSNYLFYGGNKLCKVDFTAKSITVTGETYTNPCTTASYAYTSMSSYMLPNGEFILYYDYDIDELVIGSYNGTTLVFTQMIDYSGGKVFEFTYSDDYIGIETSGWYKVLKLKLVDSLYEFDDSFDTMAREVSSANRVYKLRDGVLQLSYCYSDYALGSQTQVIITNPLNSISDRFVLVNDYGYALNNADIGDSVNIATSNEKVPGFSGLEAFTEVSDTLYAINDKECLVIKPGVLAERKGTLVGLENIVLNAEIAYNTSVSCSWNDVSTLVGSGYIDKQISVYNSRNETVSFAPFIILIDGIVAIDMTSDSSDKEYDIGSYDTRLFNFHSELRINNSLKIITSSAYAGTRIKYYKTPGGRIE